MESNNEGFFWDQLLSLIKEGHVIPVVGSELLTVRYKGEDIHLYALLARKLADYLGIPGDDLPAGDELNTVACRYIAKGKHIGDIYPFLKMVMPTLKELTIPEPLLKLVSIKEFKLFITTTFDSLLENAINYARFSGQLRTKVYSYSPRDKTDIDPKEIEDHPVVFHLFGKLSATPAFAVTQEDTLEYIHALQSEDRQPKKLFDETNKKSLLLLGCNYPDWLARIFLRTSKRRRLMEQYLDPDFVADARMCNDEDLVYFLKHFSQGTKIYKGVGSVDFINELFDRMSAFSPSESSEIIRRPDDSGSTGHFKSGAVFLSYASEDVDAATMLRDALVSEQVEVFFDKDALHTGDSWEMKIKRNISESSLFIAIISKNTLTEERRFFRLEWDHALLEASKSPPNVRFVLPLSVDDTPHNHPALPSKFEMLQWEHEPDGKVSPDFVQMVKQLYREYQKRIKR